MLSYHQCSKWNEKRITRTTRYFQNDRFFLCGLVLILQNLYSDYSIHARRTEHRNQSYFIMCGFHSHITSSWESGRPRHPVKSETQNASSNFSIVYGESIERLTVRNRLKRQIYDAIERKKSYETENLWKNWNFWMVTESLSIDIWPSQLEGEHNAIYQG